MTDFQTTSWDYSVCESRNPQEGTPINDAFILDAATSYMETPSKVSIALDGGTLTKNYPNGMVHPKGVDLSDMEIPKWPLDLSCTDRPRHTSHGQQKSALDVTPIMVLDASSFWRSDKEREVQGTLASSRKSSGQIWPYEKSGQIWPDEKFGQIWPYEKSGQMWSCDSVVVERDEIRLARSAVSFRRRKQLNEREMEERALQECLRQEERASRTVSVTFSVMHQAKYGEEVRVVGNVVKLGQWNPSGAAALRWTDGHVWTATLEIEFPPSVSVKQRTLEYKYVVMKNGKVKKWEPLQSNNRSVFRPTSKCKLVNVWGKE